MALYYNVIGSTAVTTELISPTSVREVSAITVCNVHASNNATITLFIQNDPESGTTNTYNIIKNVFYQLK